MYLSIIIPSFNTKRLLENCLKSIYQSTREISFEIIIVDNNSPYDIRKQISQFKKRNKVKNIVLICNRKNFGYAKANNLGIRKAKGNYLLFLNSDTLILDRAIEKTLEYMEKHQEVDIVGCQLLNKDKSIQPSGGFLPNIGRIFYQMFFLDDLPLLNNFLQPYQVNNGNFYKKSRFLGWVSGAFFLTKKKVIKSLKGFDPDFFMYAEEVDFCYRAKLAGFKTFYYHQAKIIHYKGGGNKNSMERAILGEYMGLLKFFKKHYHFWQIKFLKFLLKSGALLRIIIFGILKKDKLKKIYEKAYRLV